MFRTCLSKNYFSVTSKFSVSCHKGKLDKRVFLEIPGGLLSTCGFYSMKMSSGLKNAEKEKKSNKKLLSTENKEKKITRSVANEVEKNYKEYYLKLPLDEKRKEYSCGKKYVMLDDVEAWSTYASKIKRRVSSPYEVDEELNMKISMWRGDITCLEIDVICNAANSSLLGGGGVDGAIHRAAGKKLYEECVKLNGCDTGDAKLSGGYKLPAKYILHTVGPIGEKPKLLTSCYKTCLDLAKENNLRTIAFPCISTGIYGYDVEKATPVVMTTVRDWLLTGDNRQSIDKIIFCVFLIKDVEVYQENLLKYFPVEKYTEIPEKKKAKTEDSAKSESKEQKEVSEKKKAKTVDLAKNENKEQKEVSEKKKTKTEDSAKSKSKDQKEISDGKKAKTENSTKSEMKEGKEQNELSQRKKSKTENISNEEAKEQKENKKEEQSVTDGAKAKSDIEICEKKRNQSKNDSIVQESYL